MDDIQLLLQIATEDEGALREFYRRYANLVFSMALSVLQNHAIAEEVTQDVFWTIWRKAALYDADRGGVKTWLLTITRRRAIDYRRRLKPTDSIDDPTSGALPTSALQSSDIDLQQALAELPDEQQACVELIYLRGFKQHEVAEQLAVPLGTVKSRIRLALKRLRERLSPIAD